MRRAKLAAAPGPTGSLPTSNSYLVPRCFVCDEPIKSHRFSTSLLSGRTQYTHSPLPTKIGGYIGDEFVVVVTPQDALCKHCMALINTMDRLELELRQHRYTLTQHLKTKYKLDEQPSVWSAKKLETVDQEEDLEEPEIIEVSDEEWTPNMPNKKQRTESSKQHRCTICAASYTNLSLFMAHLSRHKQIASKSKATAVSFLPTVKTFVSNTAGQELKFKCGCCSESFPTKESLALHMQQHTVTQTKPKVSCILSSNVSKSNNDSSSSLMELRVEPVVQTSSLFEDIEELSHHEPQAQAPGSVGVCTEEQKGRVCLLALLNNGVCSDLSHRAPPVQSSIVLNQPKEGVSSEEQTISITVSIPSCVSGGQMTEQKISIPAVPQLSNSNFLNGGHMAEQQISIPAVPPLSNSNFLNTGQMTEQQLSIPVVSQHSNSTCISYPVTFNHPPVTSSLGINSLSVIDAQCTKIDENNLNSSNQNLNMSLQTNSLDLPDLCDSFPAVSKLGSQEIANSHEVVSKKGTSTWGDSNPVENETDHRSTTISSRRLDQGMDMPNLLEDDMLPGEDSHQESSGIISGKGNRFESKLPVTSNEVGKDSKPQGKNNSNAQPDFSVISNKNGSESEKKIAIVSVKTSVQMKKEGHDENNVLTDWFYASSGKDDSSVLERPTENYLDSPAEPAWFPESDQMSVSGKLHNDKCSSVGYSISSDACITSLKITTEANNRGDD